METVMEAVIVEAYNGTLFTEQDNQPIEPSCMLLMTLVGKVLLNLFVLGSKRKNVNPSFMGYFSISVALADFILLLAISFISYFQDVALWGIRFTKYHMCLFTQIVSFTYGVMHYPVFIMAGLDYCIFLKQPLSIFQRLLYVIAVIVIWFLTLYYILTSPAMYSSLEINSYFFSYQCPFYVSIQSYRLSSAILFIAFSVLVICWFEVVALVRSFRMVSFVNESVMLFSFAPSCQQSALCKKRLLTSFMICFLGTWLPFVALQMIIVLLNAQIPAYMDMNMPWLYFLNSFLIGTALWFKQHDMECTDIFSSDPFVSWIFCFTPFVNSEHSKHVRVQVEKSVTVIIT